MKFKLDFDDLEELQNLLEEVGESMEEFESAFSMIMDEIIGNSSGEAFEKLVEISEELLPTIKELTDGYEEQAEISKQYLTGIEDINPRKTGMYELDTNEAKDYIDDAKDEINKVDGMDKISSSLSHFESSYKKQINEYHHVDGSINLEEEYPNDEDSKYYIRRKRSEIDQYINNYYNNVNQVEAVQDKLRSVNRSMEYYMNDLKGYKDIIEELKDFEDTFNPGFWDKHGQAIKAVGTIVTVVVVGAFLWEAGVVAIAGELLMSAGSAMWAAGDMVLLGISEGAVIDGVTMGAELLVEEGAAWLSEAAIGAELSGTAIIDTLFETWAGQRYLKYYLYYTKFKFVTSTLEYKKDIESGNIAELITDIITTPIDFAGIIDNEILNYNDEAMNTLEDIMQKIENLIKFDFEFNDDDSFIGNFI